MSPQQPRQASRSASTAVRDRVASRAVEPAGSTGKTLYDLVNDQRAELERAMPRHFDADRFLRLLLTEFRTVKHLADCDFRTVMAAAMQAARLGLEPGGVLGHAYLLPFWSERRRTYECTFILGYKGMVDLATRGGRVLGFDAEVVHERDDFEYALGSEPFIRHRPRLANRGEAIAYYVIARYPDGQWKASVQGREWVESRRARSKAKDSGPWVTDYDAMAKKTVLRAMFPWLPVTIEAAEAVIRDERRELGLSDDVLDLTADDDEQPPAVGDGNGSPEGEASAQQRGPRGAVASPSGRSSSGAAPPGSEPPRGDTPTAAAPDDGSLGLDEEGPSEKEPEQ